MKPSNFSSFIEKYQKCLKHQREGMLIFKFEDCIMGSSVKACDYAVAYKNRNELILVECKEGTVSPYDFNKCIEQLQESIEKIFEEFGEPPDRAILCYDKLDHVVSWLIQTPKMLRHKVRFQAKKIGTEPCINC
ncbi:MAG: hypothetical protein LZ173_00290 [Thaumarchaeota archaeon]|nr:hypothetical protein [Candidatus Geocrenenecus arthurdayi]